MIFIFNAKELKPNCEQPQYRDNEAHWRIYSHFRDRRKSFTTVCRGTLSIPFPLKLANTCSRGVMQKGKHAKILCAEKNWDILYIVRKLSVSLMNLREQEAWGLKPFCLSLALSYFSPTSIILFVLEILTAVSGWRPRISLVCLVPTVFLTAGHHHSHNPELGQPFVWTGIDSPMI